MNFDEPAPPARVLEFPEKRRRPPTPVVRITPFVELHLVRGDFDRNAGEFHAAIAEIAAAAVRRIGPEAVGEMKAACFVAARPPASAPTVAASAPVVD